MAAAHVSKGFLTIIVVSMIWSGAKAQQTDCTNVIMSMSPCLNYITGNSSTPSSACCTQLGTVVRSQPQCLCQVLNGGGSNLGLTINQTQALALPRECNVQTPSINQCQASSPSGSPGSSPSSPNSGDGSRTVPGSRDGTSDASYITTAFPMMCSLMFIVSCFNFKNGLIFV